MFKFNLKLKKLFNCLLYRTATQRKEQMGEIGVEKKLQNSVKKKVKTS